MPTPEDHGPCLPTLYGASKQAERANRSLGWNIWVTSMDFQICEHYRRERTHGVIFDFIHKFEKRPIST